MRFQREYGICAAESSCAALQSSAETCPRFLEQTYAQSLSPEQSCRSRKPVRVGWLSVARILPREACPKPITAGSTEGPVMYDASAHKVWPGTCIPGSRFWKTYGTRG